MTKEEIIEMAKLAGWEMDDSLVLEPEIVWYISQGQLETFAKLIAEKEREACAKIAENRILHDENKDIKKGYLFAQQSIAQDIRTRGQE